MRTYRMTRVVRRLRYLAHYPTLDWMAHPYEYVLAALGLVVLDREHAMRALRGHRRKFQC